MTVADLIGVKTGMFTDDKQLKCELIALDGYNGKVLFDTSKNRQEFIDKFMSGEVIALWADVKLNVGNWSDYFYPVMKCYVSHDSWKGGE